MKKQFVSIFRLHSFNYDKLAAMISRNGGHSLIGVILRLFPTMGGRVSPSVVKSLKTFFITLSHIAATQGLTGLVKFLKSVSVVTQQSICGHKVHTITPRISRTKAGLPRVFPIFIRRLIRQGNRVYIRLALTLASLYRDIMIPGKLKLETITSQFSGSYQAIESIGKYIPRFVRLFVDPHIRGRGRTAMLWGKFSWIPIAKASPQSMRNVSTHPLSLIRSAKVLTPEQVEDLSILSSLSTVNRLGEGKIHDPIARLRLAKTLHDYLPNPLRAQHPYSGKLGLKLEPAGKLRVFAMVDPWTQLVMNPIHQAIFQILGKHPKVDGTFDQLGPLKRAFGSKKPLFSMDLSSATDRLPMLLQKPLIQEIFNFSDQATNAWARLLIDRDYMVPTKASTVKTVRYAVGQPMGALSSWAMLAMTHHLIVQAAAWDTVLARNPNKLFADYAILGDDIVIYNSHVAKRYHSLILSIGVECNLSKSILSPKGIGLEFAKRTFFHGDNVSPSPLKEYWSALQNLVTFIGYCKKYSLKLTQALKVAGFGYRVIGGINRPYHRQNIKVKYLIFMSAMDPNSMLVQLSSLRRNVQEIALANSLIGFIWYELLRLSHRYGKGVLKARALDHDNVPGIELFPDKVKSIYSHIGLPFSLALGVKVEKLLTLCYKEVMALIPDLKYLMRRRDYDKIMNLPTLVRDVLNILDIQARSSQFSLDSLYKRDLLIKRPGNPRLFRFHQAWLSVFDRIRHIKDGLSPIDVMTNQSKAIGQMTPMNQDPLAGYTKVRPSNFMKSGFGLPLVMLRKLLVRRSSLIIINRARVGLLAMIRRRLIYTGGCTVVLGAFSAVFGITQVITFVVAIWSAIQVLISTPGVEDRWGITAVIGNIILHSAELYLSGLILVCGYYWEPTFLFAGGEIARYWASEQSLMLAISNICTFANMLLYHVAWDTVPQLIEGGRSVVNAGIVPSFALGAILAFLANAILRWFLGL